MKNVAVFASGSGTNFEAIIQAIEKNELECNCKILISDKPSCYCIERAKNHNIKYFAFNPKDYGSKKEYEEEIIKILKEEEVDLVVLAGYMRLISETLLEAYENKIINIHPALLPSFKGKDGIKQAYDFGCKVFGITIHYVNIEMDGGKIIAQDAFRAEKDDNLETIEAKIHALEHKLYVETLKELLKED